VVGFILLSPFAELAFGSAEAHLPLADLGIALRAIPKSVVIDDRLFDI
jgi:hypothetical protein